MHKLQVSSRLVQRCFSMLCEKTLIIESRVVANDKLLSIFYQIVDFVIDSFVKFMKFLFVHSC